MTTLFDFYLLETYLRANKSVNCLIKKKNSFLLFFLPEQLVDETIVYRKTVWKSIVKFYYS